MAWKIGLVGVVLDWMYVLVGRIHHFSNCL